MDRDRPPAARPYLAARRKPGTLPRRLPQIAFNIALTCAMFSGSIWLLGERCPVEVPSAGILLLQLAIIFVWDDFAFYWVHRAMHHSKWLYRHVHRRHHEASAPVPIEFIYVHPLELIGVGIGTGLGPGLVLLLFGEISAWTLWIGAAVRLLHELQIHSGLPRISGAYIPFLGSTEHHARHHANPTGGNYASTFTHWDRLFGTGA
jgi:sterol desaturase/sphingolipid hydroxylase (fatty acid hydroxylase superfamily)